MSKFSKNLDKAKKSAKDHFGNECIICLSPYIDAAHIFPAGRSKYIHLRTVDRNLVPLCRYHHQIQEWKGQESDKVGYSVLSTFKREPWSRINWMVKNCHPSKLRKLKAWIGELKCKMRSR